MSQQLIQALIDGQISLNQLNDWINLCSNEEKLLEVTKYSFVTYFVSNIHSSTHWLTNVSAINSNSKHNSLNSSPIKSSSKESNDKLVDRRSGDKINCDLIERKLNKIKNRKLITIKDLTKKVDDFDLNDENLFPTLGSETITSKDVTNNEKTISETSISVNNASVLCRRKRRIKPTAIKGLIKFFFWLFEILRYSLF